MIYRPKTEHCQSRASRDGGRDFTKKVNYVELYF